MVDHVCLWTDPSGIQSLRIYTEHASSLTVAKRLWQLISQKDVKSLREVEVLLQVPATTNSMLRPLPPVPLHLSACRQRPSDKGISLTLLRFIKRKICLLEVSQHGGTPGDFGIHMDPPFSDSSAGRPNQQPRDSNGFPVSGQ